MQRRFERNTHQARRAEPAPEESAETAPVPRYWLTGKLFCGRCGDSMHGIHGTSHIGDKHYYYACKSKRKHKCKLKNVPKDDIEFLVIQTLREFLKDTENLASFALDISAYYKRLNADDSYLKALEHDLKETEKAINNLIRAVEAGVLSDTITARLKEQEGRKTALKEAIEAEKVKKAIADNEISIQHFFEEYAHADFDDDQTRDTVLNYFIDRIYVYDDKLLIMWYYSDDKTEVALDEWTRIADNDEPDAGVEMAQDAGAEFPAQGSTLKRPSP